MAGRVVDVVAIGEAGVNNLREGKLFCPRGMLRRGGGKIGVCVEAGGEVSEWGRFDMLGDGACDCLLEVIWGDCCCVS